ncbi:hypothetical protein RF11_01983 [Thelohanellus kitauei]|uniref:Uncharacterized protein n=1 Tax=Thelohanellus kitauei TaxID=669202 RepID=A0A0C2N275_THEKT|nr:hypothetical protein RF11_01983 [Thelohanellus kitauei]
MDNIIHTEDLQIQPTLEVVNSVITSEPPIKYNKIDDAAHQTGSSILTISAYYKICLLVFGRVKGQIYTFSEKIPRNPYLFISSSHHLKLFFLPLITLESSQVLRVVHQKWFHVSITTGFGTSCQSQSNLHSVMTEQILFCRDKSHLWNIFPKKSRFPAVKELLEDVVVSVINAAKHSVIVSLAFISDLIASLCLTTE